MRIKKGPILPVGSLELDLEEVVEQIKLRDWATRYTLEELLPDEVEIPLSRNRLPRLLRWLFPHKIPVRVPKPILVSMIMRARE